MAPAHALKQALGALPGCSLGVELAVHLDRTTLELAEPRLERALGASLGRSLGCGGLLGLGQLPLNALQPRGQRARVALARVHTATQPVDLGTTLAFEIAATLLGLHAQSLLGVL